MSGYRPAPTDAEFCYDDGSGCFPAGTYGSGSDGVAVVEAKLNGEPATLAVENDGYFLLLAGAGRHELVLTMRPRLDHRGEILHFEEGRRRALDIYRNSIAHFLVIPSVLARAALAGLPVEIVHNPDWESGQSLSLRAGLGALPPNPRRQLARPHDRCPVP